MKIVQINSVCGSGSTGKICVAISKLLTEHHIENYIFYAVGDGDYPLGKKYMFPMEGKIAALQSRIFGNFGFQSKAATKRLIKALDGISPDVVQLHNLHSHHVDLQLLFSYLKRKNVKVFWTFHDCFAFTSYCMYFDMVGCNQWKNGCEKCAQFRKYSWVFDRSKALYKKKNNLFSDLDLTIITPSQWLADITKESFLKAYPVHVIPNGIDLNLFTPRKSNFREKHGISKDKTMVLGVADQWERRKGLDVFIRLAEKLDVDRFQVVLVGTNDRIDKQLPRSIISIHRTACQKELAEIYSAADYFVNPTREDNFPAVNLEALACGTPVITFETGGSPEALTAACGVVIRKDDFDGLCRAIEDQNHVFTEEACVKRAQEFKQEDRFSQYIKLYDLQA